MYEKFIQLIDNKIKLWKSVISADYFELFSYVESNIDTFDNDAITEINITSIPSFISSKYIIINQDSSDEDENMVCINKSKNISLKY